MIKGYALAGAIGAAVYLEPFCTKDQRKRMTDATRRAQAKAFIEETASRKLARRRATARLEIGERFRIFEKLHKAQADIAGLQQNASSKPPGSHRCFAWPAIAVAMIGVSI